MKNDTADSETTDNFLTAMASISETKEIVFEYRIYYNKTTRKCLYKAVDTFQPGEYVNVTREQYDQIDLCSNYSVNEAEEIVIDEVTSVASKMITLGVKPGSVAIKDDNIFIAGPGYTGETDNWTPTTTKI